jgi:hypothetical protein
LTLLLLANVDRAPPPSKRVLVGHVAVTDAIEVGRLVPVGPETLLTTTWVWLIVVFVKHTPKGWTV